VGEATCRPFAPPQALPPHLVRWDVIHLPILCLERCGAIKVHVDHFACDDRQGGLRGLGQVLVCWRGQHKREADEASKAGQRQYLAERANHTRTLSWAHGSHVSLSLPTRGTGGERSMTPFRTQGARPCRLAARQCTGCTLTPA
jgi:hypothetical protein